MQRSIHINIYIYIFNIFIDYLIYMNLCCVYLIIYCRWSLVKGPQWTSDGVSPVNGQLWAYSRLSQIPAIPAIPAPLMSLEMRPATYTSHRATFQKHLNSLRSVDARRIKIKMFVGASCEHLEVQHSALLFVRNLFEEKTNSLLVQ